MKMKIKSITRMLLPYVLIILFPIISLIVSWNYIINRQISNEIERQKNAIISAKNDMDGKLTVISDVAEMITNSGTIMTYVLNNRMNVENDYFSVKQVQDVLASAAKNNVIEQIFLYDNEADRLIASDTALRNARLFFQYSYIDAEKSVDEVVNLLKNDARGVIYLPAKSMTVGRKTVSAIEYRQPIPVSNRANPALRLVICIDADKLFENFSDQGLTDTQVSVYQNNELVYEKNAKNDLRSLNLPPSFQPISGLSEDFYGMQTSVNSGKWVIKLLFPVSGQRQHTMELLKNQIWMVAIPLMVCIVLCIFFTYKNYREIVNVLKSLRYQQNENDDMVDYRLVQKYAAQTVQASSEYKNQLAVAHHTSTLERLLHNAYYNDNEKQSAIEKAELRMDRRFCRVLLIKPVDDHESGEAADFQAVISHIDALFSRQADFDAEYLDHAPDEIVCVLKTDQEGDAFADSLLALITEQFSRHGGRCAALFALSDSFPSYTDLDKAYFQAMEIIHYCEQTGRFFCTYRQYENKFSDVYYPIHTSEKIANFLLAGQAEDAKAVIMTIYLENFMNHNRVLNKQSVGRIKNRLYYAITSVAEQQKTPLPENAEHLMETDDMQQFFEALQDLIDALAADILSRKDRDDHTLADQVQEYIEQHYPDPELMIQSVASHFHFNENYISKLYKARYGENLSSAITRMRIEKAAELLSDTGMRIQEVARNVGYVSDVTFRRSFKNLTGLSPVDYRKAHAPQN